MILRKYLLEILTGVLLIACNVGDPYAPRRGDELLTRGTVKKHSYDLSILDTYPPSYDLIVTGQLPSSCHQLRAEVRLHDEPKANYISLVSDAVAEKIDISLYSVIDNNAACLRVIKPFNVGLFLERYSPAASSIWLNGMLLEEFAPISPTVH